MFNLFKCNKLSHSYMCGGGEENQLNTSCDSAVSNIHHLQNMISTHTVKKNSSITLFFFLETHFQSFLSLSLKKPLSEVHSLMVIVNESLVTSVRNTWSRMGLAVLGGDQYSFFSVGFSLSLGDTAMGCTSESTSSKLYTDESSFLESQILFASSTCPFFTLNVSWVLVSLSFRLIF